jgi:hypothetical protein
LAVGAPTQPQGRAFGVASFELFDTLRKIVDAPAGPEKQLPLGLDVDVSLASIERGTADLARFVQQSHDAIRACLNSGLLFAPARGRDNTADHLRARTRGEYIHVGVSDAPSVLEPLERAAWRTAQAVIRRFVDHAQPSLTLH